MPGKLNAQISSGTYPFSGGNGSANNPFQISKAQDLLDLSAAVDAQLTYTIQGSNTSYSYAAANYVMTQDIDMSAVEPGPFIVCKRTIQRSTSRTNHNDAEEVSYVTKIISAKQADDDSYTCARMAGDTYGTNGTTNQSDEVTVTSTSTVTHYQNWAATGNTYYYTKWEYSYYEGVNSLPVSALMLPIGSIAAYDNGNGAKTVDGNKSISFSGIFDGNNKTISNLTVVADATSVGLFGYVSGDKENTPVIKNLNMTNADITATAGSAAVVCGVMGTASIQNCAVTNSTIVSTGNVGGIVGNMTYTTQSNTSNGGVTGCSAQDNEFTGDGYVGGLVGSAIDKEKYVSGDANNVLNAPEGQAGTIVGRSGDYTGYQSKDPEMTDDDIANVALSKLIPDYCYINGGTLLDPDNATDKTKLDKLAEELNGNRVITDNIVLPDLSKLSASFTVNVAKIYGDPTLSENPGSGLRWYLNKENGEYGYGLTDDDVYDAQTVYQKGWSYGDVRTEGTGTKRTYYFDVNGSKYYYVVKNYYDGWPEALKTHVTQYYADAVSTKLTNEEKYYKLTATEITIDQNNGGGVLDKANQLDGVTINFKRQYVTNCWNLEGHAQVGGTPYVSYLRNNLDENGQKHDMAALRYDYEGNSWDDGAYLLAWNRTYYGEGLFVWPFDAETLPTYDGSVTEGKAALGIHPIITQTGNFVDYATVDAGVKEYIEGLENKGTDAQNGGYWFSLANPYLSRLDIAKVLESLGDVQGNALYEYNINEVDQSQTGWYSRQETNNLKGGQGFMVATENAGKLQGAFSKENLYGWSYTPGGNVSDNNSKKSAKTKAKDDSQKMVFISIDKYNRAKTLNVYFGKGENGFDKYDVYALLSGAERYATEPYFTVEGRKVWDNAFSSLPYETPVSFHSDNDGESVFAVTGNLGDITVTFIDMHNGTETVMNDANVRLNLEKGENDGRYKIRFAKKSSSLTDIASSQQADVRIWNNNREININGNNLQRVDVVNMLGQTVYTDKISGNEHKFDLNAKAGAYIIKVQTLNGTKSEKVVVK